MSETKVVNVDFFTRDTLPPRLAAVALEQDVELGDGLIMVKTKIGSPPSYDFEPVGSSPEEVLSHMAKVAREEGVDLGKAVTRAFGDETPP